MAIGSCVLELDRFMGLNTASMWSKKMRNPFPASGHRVSFYSFPQRAHFSISLGWLFLVGGDAQVANNTKTLITAHSGR